MNGNTIGGNVRVDQSNSQAFRLIGKRCFNNKENSHDQRQYRLDTATSFFTATGSSGIDTIIVIVKGSITSHGKFQLANGSGASSTWYVGGDINALFGTFTTHSIRRSESGTHLYLMGRPSRPS